MNNLQKLSEVIDVINNGGPIRQELIKDGEEAIAATCRPSFCVTVLLMLGYLADGDGRAGPFIYIDEERYRLLDGLARLLVKRHVNDNNIERMRPKVVSNLEYEFKNKGLAVDMITEEDIEEGIFEHRIEVMKNNISRELSFLYKVEILDRLYHGEYTDLKNRGGERVVSYTLSPWVQSALTMSSVLAQKSLML